MQFTSCGTEIPVGAAFCPTCGAVSPYKVSESGITPYDYTAASSPYVESPIAPPPPPPAPSTNYGWPSYGIEQQNTYQSISPYPPLFPAPRRKVNIGLIIGVVVLVLLVAGVGLFVVISTLAKNNPPGNVTASPATTAQSNPTIAATSPAITPTSAGNLVTIPYSPYKGTPVLNDPLSNNSQGYNWMVTSDSNGSCAFTGGAYHVGTQKGGYFYPCMANASDFDNFAYEVQMKIVKGDCGAILFRVDSTNSNFYYFRVCQDGTYALYVYANNNGSNLIQPQSSSAINAGLNQPNLVAVVAQGDTLDLYVNQQKVNSISDSSYSHGKIGVVADGFPANHQTEVVYSNARVWKL